MIQEKILFVGGCGHGKPTTNGVAAKNYHLVARLKETCKKVIVIDTDGWKKNPLILIRLLSFIPLFSKYRIVISLNTPSAYHFIRSINKFFPRRKIWYFVIGGVLSEYMKTGKVKLPPYSCVKWFMVESQKMQSEMNAMGFNNVIYLPNFKKIEYIPEKPENKAGRISYVFLSRIMPEKGCDYILQAMSNINQEGLTGLITMHFYGKIDHQYEKHFLQTIDTLPNVEYKGFLDLRKPENYDILAKYDMMLFPTYWQGEGFPGIVIDAYIAGLPVIASDWGHNKEIISNKETGIIISSHDSKQLTETMKYYATHQDQIGTMSKNCRDKAMRYDTRHLLSEDFLKYIF